LADVSRIAPPKYPTAFGIACGSTVSSIKASDDTIFGEVSSYPFEHTSMMKREGINRCRSAFVTII
jgi:hypothetical protein